MGLFVGGAPLEIDYSLASTSNAYKSASQLRNIKVCTTNENYLHKRKDETTSLKFDGKLDTSSSSTSKTELDKKQFIHALRDLVQRFGLQTFFYMPNSNLTGMISVVTDSHLVTLEAVIQEHKDRLNDPLPVFSRAVDGSLTTTELASSTSARFRCYDEYERNDIALSRLAVECLISETLRGEVETRFEHDPLFHEYAGQVYYMMVLEVVNASTTHDIDAASKAFDTLSLDTFPGENINKFSTEALRLIHIMRGAYALPYQLGSKLLSKVDNTQSTYFNQQVHDLKKVARSMEIAHGCLRDPKLLESASDYKTHGPIPLCSSLQREYGELKKTNEWPALSSTLPEGNYSSSPRRCFRCNSPDHLMPDCPVPADNANAHDNGSSASGSGGRTGGGGRNSGRPDNGSSSTITPPPSGSPASASTPNSSLIPGAVWKYIKPANLDQEITMNGNQYWYCAKCRCTRTNKTGFYNRTHPTSQHVAGAGLGATSRAAAASTSGTASESSSAAPGQADSNLSPVEEETDSADSASVDADPDGFSFHGGAYCSEVNDSAWMTSVSTSSDEDLVPPIVAPHLSAAVASCNLSSVASSSASATCAADSILKETSEDIKISPIATVPTVLNVPQTMQEASTWIKSSPHTPSDNGMVRASLALEAYSLPRHSSWPRNVVSSIPGYTLYDDRSIEVGTLPGPCHCTNCGDLGDYKSDCITCHGTHLYHDDSDYEHPYLSDSDDNKTKTTSSYFYLSTSTEPFYFDSLSTLPDESQSSPVFYDCLGDDFCSTKTVSTSFSARSSALTPTFAPSSAPSTNLLTCFVSGLSHLLLFISTLCWDTIYLYKDPSSPVQPYLSRKTRRSLSRRRELPLRAFPSRWLLLSYFALSPAFLQYPFPSLGITNAVNDTFYRVEQLHQLVEFSPGVHMQFHGLRLQELQSLSTSTLEPSIDEITSSSHTSDHFLDSYQTILEMEGDDFFDALEEPHSTDATFDWLNLSSMISPHKHIWADHQYYSDDLSNPVISAQANSALLPPTLGEVDLYPAGTLPSSFPVIFDSGASLAISPSSQDFVGPIIPLPDDRRLGGMAGGMPIAGIGKIAWTFQTPKGNLTVHSKCYHVPDAGARLLSPQRLFSSAHGVSGSFTCAEKSAILNFEGVGSINVNYDPNNHLPISLAKNLARVQANLTILDESNQNLTPSQKLLLLWHGRFGHKSFSTIQRLLRQSPFGSESFKGASRCSIPRCEVCEHAKAHRRGTKGSKQRVNPDTDGSIRSNCLTAGASVSVDHFESRLQGRTLTSYGRDSSDKYVGGCIFVDHMSGYIHVEPQLGFSGSETIRAKQNFERMALNHGLLIESYLCDNGIFKGKAFVRHLQEHNQKVHYCGVNAHHKNAVAERSIRTVSECARALLLHSALRWKDGPINSDLWPFAVEHACYLYNRCPDSSNSCPADRFLGTVLPRHKFKELHTWGCPVYVLDPKLQQGQKLPRWEPRARRGVFLGYSSVHSSDVPLILNLTTGSISPQYHVVFDDTFSTVISLSLEEDPPEFWNDVDLDDYVSRIHLDEDTPATLADEWLTPSELEERRRSSTRSQQIRQSFPVTAPLEEPPNTSVSLEESKTPSSPPSDTPTSRAKVVSFSDTTTATTPTTLPSVTPNAGTGVSSTSSPRRSTRVTKGTFQSTKYVPVFLSSILDPTRTHHESELAYLADLSTDFDTEEYHCTDPRAYAAKHKINDPDMPTYTNALSGPHSEEYMAAMKKEVKQLIKQKTWTAIHRKDVPTTDTGQSRPILRGTWAFKLKRLPDGSPSKFKARYCVRGDLQREGIDYFETYAPVVQWSTVRLLLTLILSNNWTTKQVDYTNAFAQATLNEEVYIESPRGFSRGDGKGVLKLNNSLYGLKQAPKTFFDKLRDGLLERGFTQSILDPCLFMKKDMICVIYVDDTIIAGPDSVAIDELIKSLGIKKEDQVHSFELRDEGEVGDFLGIRIERGSQGNFELTQTGLIDKVLKESKMSDSKSTVKTPASTTPLGIDKDGDPFNESWEYPVIVGMLMFLAQNTRPDIAYAVHQCARFTHNPKDSHAIAVKRILRYLNGTRTGGMSLRPTGDLQVDCYVDADFAGLWKVEDDQDPLCVKSRSGYLITFMNCPLLWTSKLQTQIALSTMESEYIALSQSMRELIGVREVLKEIYEIVLKDSASFKKVQYTTHAKTFGSLPSSIVHEDNESCLRFATVPKMSPRTKHIALPYHFFRSKVANKEIQVRGIDTNNQLADQFTKGLPQDKFLRDRKILLGW